MNESNVAGISVRAIACIVIIVSFCGLAVGMRELAGLKEIALIACGYLFSKAQSVSAPNTTKDTTDTPTESK